MRIAIFSDSFLPEVNGVAVAVRHAATAFSALGHDVAVVTVSSRKQEELQSLVGDAFRVITLPSLQIPIYSGVRTSAPLGFSLPAMREFRPDVIHTHLPFAIGWEAVLSAKYLCVPLVGTHHTFYDHYLRHVHLDYEWAKKLSWRYTAAYYNRCDVVVSPTESLAVRLKTAGLLRPIEVVLNPVDTETFRPPRDASEKKSLREALGISGVAFAYMGRVSYEKNIDGVIRAFSRLAQTHPDAHLQIIGDGPERANLERLAGALGVSPRVHFMGMLHDEALVRALQAQDVFVTASKSENMPISVLEAMACGLPVLAADALGLREIVKDGESGFLIPPDSLEVLADRMRYCADHPSARMELGKTSHELSVRYARQRVAQDLLSVYRKAIGKKL